MLKILSTDQIRAADQATIYSKNISSVELMEKAARACTRYLTENYAGELHYYILCGMGNNGGDGLAIARLLHQYGLDVSVGIILVKESGTEDFELNLKRLRQLSVSIDNIHDSSDFNIPPCDIIIDALFGSGLDRPITGQLGKIITAINQHPANTISIDIPSGLFADFQENIATQSIIEADTTLSFQLPKLAFFLPEGGNYVGTFYLLDIGLDHSFIDQEDTFTYLLERADIRNLIKTRPQFSHKGSYGHALIIAGSYGKIGAAVLSARACARSGVGLVSVLSPRCGYEILQIAVPEAMCLHSDSTDVVTNFPEADTAYTYGIGPGLGQDPDTVDAFRSFLRLANQPLVLDADALNILSNHNESLSDIPKHSILTPHPGELRRLIGDWDSDQSMLMMTRDFAHRYNVIIIVKGAYSKLFTPNGQVYINPTGNAGMATGGSGDVLTGIITGLLAQGYESIESAKVGMYLHGLAGDLAKSALSMSAIIASDIINYLSEAFIVVNH